MRRPLNRMLARLGPIALVAPGIVIAMVAGYHALDSWYLQTANASRLRAEYSAVAANRFRQYASEALESDSGQVADTTALFAKIFVTRQLLPFLSQAPHGNAGAFRVQILRPNGDTVFSSGKIEGGDFVSRDKMKESEGGFSIAVSARKSSAAWLATEHLASRMALILWLIGGSCVASVIAVRLMGREARLARARTDFVSSVSHELRTPLAQIQIFLETLRLGRYTSDAQRDWIFSGMQREVTRLTTLVNNVLQFSRSERHDARSIGEKVHVELAPFLADIIEGFTPLAAVRSMKIECDCSGMTARLAPDAFRQVMLNLLDNAVKYGPDGQTIKVSATDVGESVEIAVEDRGPGVPERDRTRVWNAFERGGDAEGTVMTGSGIGLSVVRDIVLAHDGSVSIEDSPGGGARFVVRLPQQKEH